MQLMLRLSGTGISDEHLHTLARQLANTIEHETDVSAALSAADSAPGSKGDAVTLGTLALTFISSGAAVALFEVLKTYFSRESSLEVEFEGPNGTRASFSAQNMAPERMQQTIESFKDLVESR